jgi:predicted ATPase
MSREENLFKWREDCQPYIKHIRFPIFKKFNNQRINFLTPLTVITGPNGCGKSSILQALYGAPLHKSLGDYWFETKIDNIPTNNRFIYGYDIYHQAKSKENRDLITKEKTIEVLKYKGTRKDHVDYWESSDPQTTLGMESEVLWHHEDGVIKELIGKKAHKYPPIKKNVLYLDFRSELSAFDKFMYFKKAKPDSRNKRDSKQDILRKKSKTVAKLLDGQTQIHRDSSRSARNEELIILNQESPECKAINKILGKNYTAIKLLKHSIYRNNGDTGDDFAFTVKFSDDYSDAVAGSGEISIVTLVTQILNAPEKSLILLDEPETSLHPDAQYKLKNFLLEQCLKKKHQIVIASHSEYFIRGLPDESIKQITDNNNIWTIRDITPSNEALKIIGVRNLQKINIIVEDKAAKLLLEAALKHLDLSNSFKIITGGQYSTMIKTYSKPYYKSNSVFFSPDGDMYENDKTHIDNYHQEDMPDSHDLCIKLLSKLLSPKDIEHTSKNTVEFINTIIEQEYPNIQRTTISDELRKPTCKALIKFLQTHIHYLPILDPETFLYEQNKAYLKKLQPESIPEETGCKVCFEKIIRSRGQDCNSENYHRFIEELIKRDRSQEEGAIDFSIFKDYFERIKKTSA